MLKRLPSRNQRTKGFRAKHALQICLLLGVCFWLIYQVKHSHDKKKEFDENDGKTTISRVSNSEIPKLGRKDLHPREDITKNEKHEEEEEEEIPVEEEEQHGEEREEEENKNESQEQEEEEEENKNEDAEENKNEEEDGGRGGGDDEIDENDQEKKEEEGNHDEEFLDEDKEREEEGGDDSKKSDNEEIEDRVEKENSSEDQDSDGGETDHEAREEHYIRDDASSEVAHDTQVISTGTEKISSESTDENTETKTLEQEDKSDNSEDVKKIKNDAGSKVGEGETGGNHTPLDVVSREQKVDYDDLSNSSTTTIQSNDHPEGGNNSTEVTIERFDSSEPIKIEMNVPSQQNKTESVTVLVPGQITKDVATTREGEREEVPSLVQTDNSTIGSEENKVGFTNTNSTKTEKADGTSEELSNSSKNPVSNASEKVVRPEEKLQVEDGTTSSTMKENGDASENGKSDIKIEFNGEENNSNSTDGTEEAVQHDPIDSSDNQIAQEMNEVRMDLSTLPDMDSQRVDIEEVAAE